MPEALIGLGGNVGDVRATFVQAIAQICSSVPATLLKRSSDYSTPPWGETAQPAFINACISVATDRDPGPLLAGLHRVEAAFGRNRASEQRWGPRTLDLDLLAYDDLQIDRPDLILPHPRLFERAFVLVPLAEIAPTRRIDGRLPAEVLRHLPVEGIDRLPALP